MRRIKRGDRRAFDQLHATYQPRLVRYVDRMLNDSDTSLEAVNDTMLAIWRGASGFRGDARVSTWIFGIAYRQALKALSKRRYETDDRSAQTLVDGGFDQLENEDFVDHYMSQLSVSQRSVVELTYAMGLSYDEIAEIMECPVNTVKTRMYHARRSMRQAIVTEQAHAGGSLHLVGGE